jgi:hypothetical protein
VAEDISLLDCKVVHLALLNNGENVLSAITCYHEKSKSKILLSQLLVDGKLMMHKVLPLEMDSLAEMIEVNIKNMTTLADSTGATLVTLDVPDPFTWADAEKLLDKHGFFVSVTAPE